MTEPLLELRSLCKRFGALPVTDGVSLRVMPGEVHALIGPNGAGKSTLVAQICGELRSDSGEILLAGQQIDRLPPHRRALAGLARAYQVPSLFGSLRPQANVTVPLLARLGRVWRFWSSVEHDRVLADTAAATLKRVRLHGPFKRPAEQIAHGQKRQLELAMSLASRPKLLLLDEPLAGLGRADAQDMIGLLKSLKGEAAMLLVEHDMEAVFALADRISVLVGGRVIACGTVDAIRADAAVRAAYLGEGGAP